MKLEFDAKVLEPAESETDWGFIVLPQDVSAQLSRRGRLVADVVVNTVNYQVLLEPDGKKSHWFMITAKHMTEAGMNTGDTVSVSLTECEQQPEPAVPEDLSDALASAPQAQATWENTTTLARVDWIHWVESAKQARTRTKRISDACSMLAEGKKRVCCFDTSGFYSKALSSPKTA